MCAICEAHRPRTDVCEYMRIPKKHLLQHIAIDGAVRIGVGSLVRIRVMVCEMCVMHSVCRSAVCADRQDRKTSI